MQVDKGPVVKRRNVNFKKSTCLICPVNPWSLVSAHLLAKGLLSWAGVEVDFFFPRGKLNEWKDDG